LRRINDSDNDCISVKAIIQVTKVRKTPILQEVMDLGRRGERQQKSACLSKGGDMQSIPEELGALSLEGGLDGCLYIPDESSQPL
jgi:hypothetical protein